MATETLNMKSVSIGKFVELVKESIEDEDMTPIVGIGKSGVGKTQSIFELTQELKIGFREIRLVTMMETDLLGIPMISDKGTTTWAQMDLLPRAEEHGERGILVLDEITSASANIRAAAYQLLDSKRALGEYKLPDKWLVVALGNGPDDGGVFAGMECAFLNRAMCLRIEPDLDSFLDWGYKHNINSSVLAYLKFTPGELHEFNPDETAQAFPSPRSWESLSKKLNAREARHAEKNKGNKVLDTDQVDTYASMAVGAKVGARFAAFYSYKSAMIQPQDIIENKATTNPSDIKSLTEEAKSLTMTALIKYLTEISNACTDSDEAVEKLIHPVANSINWLMKISVADLDMALRTIWDLAGRLREFTEIVVDSRLDELCPDFGDFAEKNSIVYA